MWNTYRLGGTPAQVRWATKLRDDVLSALADAYDDPTAPGLDLGDGTNAPADKAKRDAEWQIIMEAVADSTSNLRFAKWWIDNRNALRDGRWSPDLTEVFTPEQLERIRALRAEQPQQPEQPAAEPVTDPLAERRARLAAGLQPPRRREPEQVNMPPRPYQPPYVWLHGNLGSPAMERLEASLREAGYFTVRDDRARAWYAARAGITVVDLHVDRAFADELDYPITLRTVRARYAVPPHRLPNGNPDEDHAVMLFITDKGGTRPRPVDHTGGIDIPTVVEWVGELVDTRLVGSGQAGKHLGLDPRDVRARLARGEFPQPDGYEPRGSRRQPWWWRSTLDRWESTRQHGAGRPRS